MSKRDDEGRLAALMHIEDTAEPPAELIDEIVATIPDELPSFELDDPFVENGADPEVEKLEETQQDNEAPVGAAREPRTWWRLAAVLATLVLGGVLVSRLGWQSSQAPAPARIVPVEIEAGRQAVGAERRNAREVAVAGEVAGDRLREEMRFEPEVRDLEPAPAVARPGELANAPQSPQARRVPSSSKQQKPSPQEAVREDSLLLIPPPPPPPPPPAPAPLRSVSETIVVSGELPVVGGSHASSVGASYLPGSPGQDGASTGASTGGTAEPNDAPYGDVFYRDWGINPFVDTEDDALSTFGLDVDTASYGIVRRYLGDGHMPPRAAVRVEEVVNFFDYDYRAPEEEALAIYADGGPTPFTGSGANEGRGEAGDRYRLLRIGVRAKDVATQDRKPASLIFVVDVSGSMSQGNRLGLVKQALGLLLGQLTGEDRVGLVVYGSRGRVLLRPTSEHDVIRGAVERLVSEGSTNAEEGLVLGYELAAEHFLEGGINRVILCSDGVANVGATGPDSILERISKAAARGIELSTVGFGMGNYNDVLMEQLANRGDGNYAYVDTLEEARRIFVEELTGTLQTVAAEAKVQVEFFPGAVERYRLLGYENRDIADRDFRNDKVDAGEIGAGHTVTALYEVKLRRDFPPRAQLGTVRLRYRPQDGDNFVEVEKALSRRQLSGRWQEMAPGARLAAVAAEFAELLRRSYWARGSRLSDLVVEVEGLAARFEGDEKVAELAALVRRAAELAEDEHDSAGGDPERGRNP